MKKKYKKFYSWVIFLVLGTSVIGLTFSSFIFTHGGNLGGGSQRPAEFEYGGFEFVQRGNVWSTYVNNNEAIFSYSPQEVTFIDVDPSIVQRMRATAEIDTTYSTADSNKEGIALAIFQLSEMIQFHSNTFLRQGLAEPNQQGTQTITCDDATDAVPVFYFQTGLSTNIYPVGSCVIVESPNQAGFILAKDRLLYAYLGIL